MHDLVARGLSNLVRLKTNGSQRTEKFSRPPHSRSHTVGEFHVNQPGEIGVQIFQVLHPKRQRHAFRGAESVYEHRDIETSNVFEQEGLVLFSWSLAYAVRDFCYFQIVADSGFDPL